MTQRHRRTSLRTRATTKSAIVTGNETAVSRQDSSKSQSGNNFFYLLRSDHDDHPGIKTRQANTGPTPKLEKEPFALHSDWVFPRERDLRRCP